MHNHLECTMNCLQPLFYRNTWFLSIKANSEMFLSGIISARDYKVWIWNKRAFWKHLSADGCFLWQCSCSPLFMTCLQYSVCGDSIPDFRGNCLPLYYIRNDIQIINDDAGDQLRYHEYGCLETTHRSYNSLPIYKLWISWSSTN